MKDFWDKLENLIGDFRGFDFENYRYNPFGFLLAPILGFLFFVFLILGNWKSIVHWMEKESATNEIAVTSIGAIDLTQVKVTWKMDYTNEMVVYQGAQVRYSDFFERGANHFYVSYNDSLVAGFSHIKTDGVNGHNYTIQLEESGRCIDVAVEIEGASDSIRWIQKPDCLERM